MRGLGCRRSTVAALRGGGNPRPPVPWALCTGATAPAPPEWRLLRSLRLEALLDSPLSYGSTHQRELQRSEREWQQRAAAGGAGEEEVAFVAIAGGGSAGPSSLAVVAWARERGASSVVLSVSDWNEGARRVYQSIGFEPTGVTKSLPWNPSVMESEMRLKLG